MRKALVTVAIAFAVSVPVALAYIAYRTLQLLAIGMLFLFLLASA